MNKLKLTMLSVFAVMGILAVPVFVGTPVLADAAAEISKGVEASNDGNNKDFNDFLKDIVNIILYILGAIAVIMIVIGGIKYTTSNGDSSSVKSAKDTILYSVVGLVVAIMAYAIVNFVLANI